MAADLTERIPYPSERVWTRRSMEAIRTASDEAATMGGRLVHIGAGFEPAMRRIIERHPTTVRVGLPHRDQVDIEADFRDLPFDDGEVSLVFSSSVLEHVDDPESAVRETHRVLHDGGLTYAEVPFMRAWHMEPHDYQRYTISGLQRVYERNGFEIVDAGVCSGPFTGWVLLLRDALLAAMPIRVVRGVIRLALGWALHPFKYLDRLCERSRWAEFEACNFYVVARKAQSAS